MTVGPFLDPDMYSFWLPPNLGGGGNFQSEKVKFSVKVSSLLNYGKSKQIPSNFQVICPKVKFSGNVSSQLSTMVNLWPLARERGYSLLSYFHFHFPGMCLLLWTMVNPWPLAGERGYSEKFPRKQILGSVSAAWSEFHRASNFSTRKNPFVFSSSSNLKILMTLNLFIIRSWTSLILKP